MRLIMAQLTPMCEAAMTRSSLNKSLPGLLPATPENIEAAQEFVMRKWVERFHERNPGANDIPTDLSSACKFTSLFAQGVFGGRLRGNEGHQYVELPDGEILDLNRDARDVIEMGELHRTTGKTGWHRIEGREHEGETFHGDPHAHDEVFFGNRDHVDSMRSVLPRVKDWIREFLDQR
jgi:hypothetical protein